MLRILACQNPLFLKINLINQIFIPRYVSISPSMWIFFMGNSCLVASREAAKLLYWSLNCPQTGTRGESTSIWKRYMMNQHFFKSSHFVSTDLAQCRKIIYKKTQVPLWNARWQRNSRSLWYDIPIMLFNKFSSTTPKRLGQYQFPCYCSSEILAT